jgi:hypothetical protein
MPAKRAVIHEEKKMTNKKLSTGILGVLLVFSFVLAGCPNGSTDDPGFAGGQGIPGSPWKIETAKQLEEVRNHLDGYYVLNADIDLSSYGNFSPIGIFEPLSDNPEDAETPKLELAFTGIFDGNGRKISNVTISAPTQAGVGLFGCVAGENGLVKNLVVENVTVTGGPMLVGGVIGYCQPANTLQDITLQGTNNITGDAMVGGIVGGGFCSFENCKAAANVTANTANANIGILAGGIETGSFISCTVTGGSISAPDGSMGIGGLAACAQDAPEVRNCTVQGVTITVGENSFMIGGLLGYAGTYSPNTPTAINNCTVENVTIHAPASAERIGGIVGSGFYSSMYAAMMASMSAFEFLGAPSAFKVTNSASSGSITGGCTDLVGKIAGYVYDNSTVEACTSTMTGATNNIGGDKKSADLSTLK